MTFRPSTFFRALMLLTCCISGASASVVFALLPSNAITGPSGAVIGFGYSIENNTSDYYQPTNFSSGPFTIGNPATLFDFPEIAPDTTATEPFAANATGLLQILLTSAASASQTGTFAIDGNLYADLSETDLVGSANLSQPYTVSVIAAATPEPVTSAPVLAFLAAAYLARRRPRRRGDRIATHRT